ncbi:MAG: hypothetical protein AAF221_13735 [Pseudomonadota bacterium]
MMLRTVFAGALGLSLLASSSLAQQAPEMDLFSDAPFEMPEAPEVTIPGGPAPQPLCTLPTTYDFEKDRYNPGLLTAAQYRRWSISGYDKQNPRHLFFLGLMIEYGHHMAKDELRAQRLYQQAADMGLRAAQERLGLIACSKELYCTSARIFFDAANRGSKRARMELSKHYRWGEGVFYDPITAYLWAWVGMERTKGNWLVTDPAGESYLRSIEDILTDSDLELAEGRINDWKNGFDTSRLRCQQD